MKTLLIILMVLIPCTVLAGPYGELNSAVADGPDWLDDALHITAGFAIATGIEYAAHKMCDKDSKAFLCNEYVILSGRLLVPLALGAVKESTDISFNAQDLAGWGVGAGLSIVLINF